MYLSTISIDGLPLACPAVITVGETQSPAWNVENLKHFKYLIFPLRKRFKTDKNQQSPNLESFPLHK